MIVVDMNTDVEPPPRPGTAPWAQRPIGTRRGRGRSIELARSLSREKRVGQQDGVGNHADDLIAILAAQFTGKVLVRYGVARM
jgi:hypothetical protein